MPDFKVIPLSPMVGMFDALSSADQIGYGNFRVAKNAVTRSQRNRQRGGGWLRFFGEAEVFNNQDLHDQLLDRLAFRDSYPIHFMGGGGISGYGYPYIVPAYTIPAYSVDPESFTFYCGLYTGDFPDGVYNGCDIFDPVVGYPYVIGITTSGCYVDIPPYHYIKSSFWTSCPTFFDPVFFPGFSYGEPQPIYSSQLAYDSVYCGPNIKYLPGCNEAITMLNEIVLDTGRKFIASTLSRIYELNQSAGNYRLLADGLGNAGYTVDQCGCNPVRGVSATMGGYLLYTNEFDPPLIYFVGDEGNDCAMQAMQIITDLSALGITRAGGVVTWKGFSIFFDLTENSERFTGDVIWSDLGAPFSYIPSDVSLAGRATIAIGERLLAAAPLGNWLMIYTDKSIIRVTLVGGTDIFNFERIYRGGNALRFKYSLINTGDLHIYLGESDIYVLTQFDTHPLAVAFISKAAGMIFNGIHEDDADYNPINPAMCDLVTGGWSEEKHEAWLSWCSGTNTCPDVTLRLNLRFNTADFVDHGFTAFMTFRPDSRPTIGQWIEDMGICPRGTHVAVGIKDGPVCEGAVAEVANPPLYIRNPEEDPALPVHPDSLCARLEGKSIDDYCRECSAPTKFVMASAQDFCLKQYEDDIYYRERLGFGSNPCRDYTFPTEAGAIAGITGPSIVLDTWLELGDVNCTVSDVAMLTKFSPCAAAGGLHFTELVDSGLSIGWQSRWQGIAFCDSLDRVIADSTDDTGIALIDFNSGPALDYVLPLNTPFETRGIFYHPKADVIIVWVRYGTFPGYTYRLAFMDPVSGFSSEIDLGVPGGTNEYEAVFTTIGFSTIGILIRSLTLGNPHLIAVVDVDTRAVVVSKFFEADGGARPTYDFYGLCYSCQLEELVTIGNKIDVDGVFFKYYIIRFNLTTLAITQEFFITQSPMDIRNPQYITSTGRLIGWSVDGYWDLDPANGNVVLFDTAFTGNVVPIYFWKIDKYITIDESQSLLLVINPHDYSKQTIPFSASVGDAYNFAVARAQGKFFVHNGLFAPFLIQQFVVQ